MIEEKAPFNSALDLLERLSKILSYITEVKQNVLLTKDLQQGFVLSLAQDYYIQSVPLLTPEAREEHKSILDVEQEKIVFTIKGTKTKKEKIVYTNAIEKKINKALIEMQIDLQDKGKYFMPPRRDKGRAVAQFG